MSAGKNFPKKLKKKLKLSLFNHIALNGFVGSALQTQIHKIQASLHHKGSTVQVWKAVCSAAGIEQIDSPTYFNDLEPMPPGTDFANVSSEFLGFFDAMGRIVSALNDPKVAESFISTTKSYTATGTSDDVDVAMQRCLNINKNLQFILPDPHDIFSTCTKRTPGIIRQPENDVDNNRITVNEEECDILDSVGACAVHRDQHALFAEQHKDGSVSINDPNHSSLQAAENYWQTVCDPDNTLFQIPEPWGWCQTWSFFELECNIMGCAGLHQQLASYFTPYHDPNILRRFGFKLYSKQAGPWWNQQSKEVKDTVKHLVDAMGLVTHNDFTLPWFGLALSEFVRRLAYRYMKLITCDFTDTKPQYSLQHNIIPYNDNIPPADDDTAPLLQRILDYRHDELNLAKIHQKKFVDLCS